MQALSAALQLQLTTAQSDATAVRLEKDQCVADQTAEREKMQAAIDAVIAERNQLEHKWQTDFEQLRTHHSGEFDIGTGLA